VPEHHGAPERFLSNRKHFYKARKNMKILGLCVAALALSTGSAAVAQNYQGYDRARPDRYEGRYDDNRYERDRRDNRFDNIRGRKLPREYLRGRFVFAGWKERGLGKPARGQEWVKICDSYMLVSVRSGTVAEVHDTGKGRVDRNRDWRLRDSFRCMR